MDDAPVEWRREGWTVSTDRRRLDVVIAPSHRGRGLGRWLTECIVAHPARGWRASAPLATIPP